MLQDAQPPTIWARLLGSRSYFAPVYWSTTDMVQRDYELNLKIVSYIQVKYKSRFHDTSLSSPRQTF